MSSMCALFEMFPTQLDAHHQLGDNMSRPEVVRNNSPPMIEIEMVETRTSTDGVEPGETRTCLRLNI
jgi:hypothetical protein